MSDLTNEPTSEAETYFHYVIKAGVHLFGEDEVRATLDRFLNAVWDQKYKEKEE